MPQTDLITRALLAAILVCQIILVVRSCDDSQRVAPPPAPEAPLAEPPRAHGLDELPTRSEGLSDADLVAFTGALANTSLPEDMRVWSALQLAGNPHPDAAEALLEALDDASPDVAMAALQGLAGNPDPRVREAALRAAGHEDEDVRVRAEQVLRSLPQAGEDAGS